MSRIQPMIEGAVGLHLVLVPEEAKEGDEEVPEDENHGHGEPAGAQARIGVDFTNDVPEGFLGDVGGVDEEVLGEADIGPEDGEG